MAQIWKHEVPVDSEWHEIQCGRVLSVDLEAHAVVFWALSVPTYHRRYRVVETGEDITRGAEFHGTVRNDETMIVGHLISIVGRDVI